MPTVYDDLPDAAAPSPSPYDDLPMAKSAATPYDDLPDAVAAPIQPFEHRMAEDGGFGSTGNSFQTRQSALSAKPADELLAKLAPLAHSPEQSQMLSRVVAEKNAPALPVQGTVGQVVSSVFSPTKPLTDIIETGRGIQQNNWETILAMRETAKKHGLDPDKIAPLPSKLEQVLRGAGNSVVDLAAPLTSPGVVVAGGLPRLLQRAISLGFSADMLSQVPGLASDLQAEESKPEGQKNYAAIVQKYASLFGTTAMGLAAGAHGVSKAELQPARPATPYADLPEATKPAPPAPAPLNTLEQPLIDQISGKTAAPPAPPANVKPPTIAEKAAATPSQPVTLADLAQLQAEMRGNQLKPSEPTPASPAKVEQPSPSEAATAPAAPTVTAPSLKPALLVNGEPVTGGNSHAEIMDSVRQQAAQTKDKAGLADALEAFLDDSKHVFVDKSGKVYNRVEAAKALGREGALQSSDLPNPSVSPAAKIETQAAKPVIGETQLSQPTVEATKNAPVAETKATQQPGQSAETVKGGIAEESRTGSGQPEPAQKYRVGNNPTLHTLVEKLPQTETEKNLGEQPVRVKNDKTGEVSTVMEEDLTPVKQSTDPKSAKSTIESKLKKLGYSDTEIQAMPKDGRKAIVQRGMSNKAADWTSATAEPETKPSAKTGESGIIELHAGIPIPKFENRKMSELDKVTAGHSAKIQKSFDEARRAQLEIKKVVPSDARQAAISVWREANGDLATLKSWESSAKGKLFKQAAKDAQNLNPAELIIAQKVIAAFDAMEIRGNNFDVLKSHRDNYVPHIWDVKKQGAGLAGNRLKERFKFSKARTFDTFFEGDQAGFVPKTLAIGKLLPAYIHEMNKVIADRQMVRDLVNGEAKDGRPLVVPRGNAKVIEGDEGKAVLVNPKSMGDVDTSDYKSFADQPALSDWTWETKDTGGNPVLMKSDLALHPEAYRRINSIVGKSAIREWYNDTAVGIARIPQAVVQGLDIAQSSMKREMFGLLAPFHQVQEGTHAVGHLVNPFFGIPKVDLRDAGQMDAAKHGLMMLPDRASSNVYLEGVGANNSLTSRAIRMAGAGGKAVSSVIDGYQDYLFHQYIPGLKYKTYVAILARNMKRYAPELKSGEMTEADVKITSAEQANAAYGHLNYALLDRNPTIQHLAQLALLAPDFLEARGRFVGQAIKGLRSKVGQEQLKAIAILAAAQAGTALVLSSLLGSQYDPKHPFEVIYNGRRYAMRSVPEDIYGLLKDTRQFIYSRVNPLTVRGAVELGTGLNYRGEKVTAIDTIENLLAGYIPITARSIPFLRDLTESTKNNPVTPLEQLAGSLGLRISRYSPISETYKLAKDWAEKKGLPQDKGSYPVSKYQKLRYALEDGDTERAGKEYAELAKIEPKSKIASGFLQSVHHPFTGSAAKDREFYDSLKGYDKQMYDLAIQKRSRIVAEFNKLKK